ncbi:Quinolinate synthase A [bioreactor metagenome]|uniref:quinolinate synthase n=1 Tax=bioreactor metagenome TaxID=1076179 RepID=A0A645IL72_9ZZZZ
MHRNVKADQIIKARELHKGIKVLVHPECEEPVRDLADFIGSTGAIIKYATEHDDKQYLIVTEQGVLHELQKKNPDKEFFMPYGSMTCVNMKKTHIEDLYNSLKNMQYEVKIDEQVRIKAYKALMNMHILGR